MVVLTVSEFNILGFSRGGDSVLGLTLGLDLEGGTHLVYRVVPEDGREPTQDDMEGVRNIIDKRVNEFGVSEAKVQLLGGGAGTVPDRVLVQIPGQTGAAITLNFGSDAVSAQTLEDFFHDNLERPDAKVKQNENLSLTVQLDEIRAEVVDTDGTVLTPSEADAWREAVIDWFPVALQIGYVLPEIVPPAGGDDTAVDSEPEETLPTLEEVQAAFASVDRSDAEIDQIEAAAGLFSILLKGVDTSTKVTQSLARTSESLMRSGRSAQSSLFPTRVPSRSGRWVAVSRRRRT